METDAPDGSTSDHPHKLLILVDDREPQCGVIAHLRQHADLLVQIKRLKTGDYSIPGKALFERKTMADFAISILDGRLFSQAPRLRDADLCSVIILEGSASELDNYGISRAALLGAMATLTLVFGIPLLRSANATETADLIRYASRQLNRHMHGPPTRPGYRPKGRKRRQFFILQGLPAVGPQRGKPS